MPKSYYQSIDLCMACDKFCAFINEIHNVIGFSMNSCLSLVSISLLVAGMPW